ncbi:MAG: DUF4115 domain-containing protein [Melioribacteraceae bacterium]|nr:DUF4115 domain-containing protein [Melioribacteraceae bacterium]MCF8263954.1 DUF4115 domain-containing protein [Melioribacteraceae bacterium]MCF8411806.1 DUF4115 domain-containing protein [Melioribacteraceae bacterium]MCF8431324.1 DUF4115 domain-containing protein [Melioribacteraceae bacterium]
MAKDLLESFSKELKAKREKAEISIQQIHLKTRIDPKFLEAIEENNFDILPEVYIRAFIREYAQTIELDPEATIEKFERARSGQSFSDTTVSKKTQVKKTSTENETPKVIDVQSPNEYQTQRETETSMSSNTILLLGSVGVIIIALLIYFIFFNSSPNQIVTERPFDEVIKEQTERFKVADSEKESSASNVESTEVATKLFSVNIVAQDSSWMRIEVDQLETFEIILLPGRNRSIEASKNVKILVGNSGAVQFFLDNQRLDFEGKSKSVRYVQIDPTGLKLLNPSDEKKNDG